MNKWIKSEHLVSWYPLLVSILLLWLKVNVTVEGVCGVCVVDGWFTASPGLSQTDWTLAGWGCTPVVHESNHGTQDKPAINTHTRGGATAMAVVPSARRIPCAWNSSKHPVLHLPVSCVGGPQGKPLRWRVVGRTLPQLPNSFYNIYMNSTYINLYELHFKIYSKHLLTTSNHSAVANKNTRGCKTNSCKLQKMCG